MDDHVEFVWALFAMVGGVAAATGTLAAFAPDNGYHHGIILGEDEMIVKKGVWDKLNGELTELRSFKEFLPPELLSEAFAKSPGTVSAGLVPRVVEASSAPTVAVTASAPEPGEATIPPTPTFEPVVRPETPPPIAAEAVPAPTSGPPTPAKEEYSEEDEEPKEDYHLDTLIAELETVQRQSLERTAPTIQRPAVPAAEPVPSPAPEVKPQASLDRQEIPLVPPVAVAPVPVPAVGSTSPVEFEVDAFRTAFLTGISRAPGEEAQAYVQRASLEYAVAGVLPQPVKAALAACLTLDETSQVLGADQMKVFSEAVELHVRKLATATKVSRHRNEPLVDYAKRVREVLESDSPPNIGPVKLSKVGFKGQDPEGAPGVPSTRDAISIRFTLALFRGVLENYLHLADVDHVIEEAEKDAIAGSGEHAAAHNEMEELVSCAQLVKHSLVPLVGKGLSQSQLEAVVKELDAFVLEMRGSAGPSGAPTPTTLEVAGTHKKKVNSLIDDILSGKD